MASRFGMSNGRLAAVAEGKLPRPCPSEKVCVPNGMIVAEALAYPGFPVERGRRIRADNVQERMDREMKRGPRVVQVFPSPESTLYLAGAVRAGRDEDWSSRRCISPESMLKLAEPAGPEPVESEASRRRGLMIAEPAMGLAGTGRRAA